jgi:hypothetical protein
MGFSTRATTEATESVTVLAKAGAFNVTVGADHGDFRFGLLDHVSSIQQAVVVIKRWYVKRGRSKTERPAGCIRPAVISS